MHSHKFNPDNSQRLDNPKRRELLPPEAVLQQINLDTNQVWVDIGCGNGYFTIPMASRVKKIYALDISDKMLGQLQERLTEQSIGNVATEPTGESRLPLSDLIADGVLLALVAHELEHPQESFKEIHRILNPGGRLIILEWIKAPMEMGPPEDHRLTAQQITTWAGEAGLMPRRSWVWANVFIGLEYVKASR